MGVILDGFWSLLPRLCFQFLPCSLCTLQKFPFFKDSYISRDANHLPLELWPVSLCMPEVTMTQ